jgi:hypothetical protein
MNSKLNKNDKFTCDPWRRVVEGSPEAVGCKICYSGPYGEKPADCTNYINH